MRLEQGGDFSRTRGGAGTATHGLGMRNGRIVHVRQLSRISDFLQDIVVRNGARNNGALSPPGFNGSDRVSHGVVHLFAQPMI
jgi:hypothetical protein